MLPPRPAVRRKRVDDVAARHHPSAGNIAHDQPVAIQAGARFIERNGDEAGFAWLQIAALLHQHAAGHAGGTEMNVAADRMTSSAVLDRVQQHVNPLRWGVQ